MIGRAGRPRPAQNLTPDQVRHLDVAERGTLTATVHAMSLGGLETVAPYLELILARDEAQVTVYADRAVYPGVLRQLRVGAQVTAVVRARDHLLHRLAVEELTVHAQAGGSR